MKILGIDEAGRGSVLGSMFLCGIICNTKDYPFLKKLGVQDSKSFLPKNAKKQRAQIALELQKKFPHIIIECNAKKIDSYVFQNALNLLEREVACKIIDSLETVDKILLDGKNIFSRLKEKYSHSEAIVRGDSKNLVIAAASIIAKNSRDHSWQKICETYQKEYNAEIKGGGYANIASEKFIRWYQEKYKKFPDFMRKSYRWKAFF